MDDFFEQLGTFSKRVFQKLTFEEMESPWQSKFKLGFPTGAVLHFTAGNNPMKTLSWFMRGKWKAFVSANVVVFDHWPEGFLDLAKDLSLISNLPAMAVQCVPVYRAAWHATWTNRLSYGIEMVNAGEVRSQNGGWVSCGDNWTEKWQSHKAPIKVFGRFWEPYSIEQIFTTINILRQLRKRYWDSDSMRSYIVGHEHVAWEKSDPGPLFPIRAVRMATLNDQSLAQEWALLNAVLPKNAGFVSDFRDGIYSWREFYDQIKGDFSEGKAENTIVKLMMSLFGYYTSDTFKYDLDVFDRQSVAVFQRMADITVDGVPGPVTQSRLLRRFVDRGMVLSP